MGGAVFGGDLVDRLWLSTRTSAADAKNVMDSDNKDVRSIVERELHIGGWKVH